MKNAKTYRIIVDYYNKKLPFQVQYFAQKSDVSFFELKCGGVNYVVVNENDNWTFIAKIEPCRELKECLVAALISNCQNVQLPKPEPALLNPVISR